MTRIPCGWCGDSPCQRGCTGRGYWLEGRAYLLGGHGAPGHRLSPPIERYARAQVQVIAGGLVAGHVDIGVFYDRDAGQRPGDIRPRAKQLATEAIAGRGPYDAMTDDVADAITEWIDSAIAAEWGANHPRFVEVWQGMGDDAEPVTQIYKPLGMPRFR